MANDNHDSHAAPTGLPAGWMLASINEIAEVVTGTTPSKSDSGDYGDSVPFVKPGDLSVRGPVKNAVEYLSPTGANKELESSRLDQ